ncbi:CD276 antigen homolog [Polymixia lowei]
MRHVSFQSFLVLLSVGVVSLNDVTQGRPPVHVVPGADATLPCYCTGSLDVEWKKPELSSPYVHVVQDGHEANDGQNPEYSGRTAVFTEQFKDGDCSLHLYRVRQSDKGTYRCYIHGGDPAVSLVELIVHKSTNSQISSETTANESGAAAGPSSVTKDTRQGHDTYWYVMIGLVPLVPLVGFYCFILIRAVINKVLKRVWNKSGP